MLICRKAESKHGQERGNSKHGQEAWQRFDHSKLSTYSITRDPASLVLPQPTWCYACGCLLLLGIHVSTHVYGAGMGCTAGPTWGVSSSLPGAEQITDPRVREAIRNQQLR